MIHDVFISYSRKDSEIVNKITEILSSKGLRLWIDKDGIESGEELLEGTVVSLNASIENGYSFNGWTVTGAVVSGNTVSETFTVGTDNVSISANISKDGASTTVEFTGTNSGGMTTTAGEQSGTIDGVTIEISNGLVSGDQIRVYKNATFTVSAPENKVVSKIEFTCTASGTSNYGPGGFAALLVILIVAMLELGLDPLRLSL